MKTFPQVSSWYQIELTRQGALDAVTLKVEPEQGFDFDEISAITAVQKQIQDKLKSALSIGIKVKIVEPRSIPRSEGKAKREAAAQELGRIDGELKQKLMELR